VTAVSDRTTTGPASTLVDHLFRNRAGQMVAYLTRLLGPEHLDLAEEVVQEALLKRYRTGPIPASPKIPQAGSFAWLATPRWTPYATAPSFVKT
jgi:predicted RNA polymerase sigma factor